MDAFRLGPLVLSAPRFYALLGLVALVVVAEVAAWMRRRAAVRSDPAEAGGASSLDGTVRVDDSRAAADRVRDAGSRGTGGRVEAAAAGDQAAWAWNAALAVVLGARLGFVIENWSVFLGAPLDVFAIWQGGFSPWWGVAAGVLTTLWSFRRRLTGARVAVVPALVALAVWLGVPALLSPAATTSARLPQLSLERLEGGTLDVASLEGRPTVINLWATWCPPCRRELPLLDGAQASYPDVQFVFADQGEVRTTVEAYLAERPELSLDNVVLDGGGRLGSTFESMGLPTTLFFDASGSHVLTHVGELSAAALLNYMTDLERGTLR